MQEDFFQLGAKALIQRPDGKVLLLKKNKPSTVELWDLPGGRIQRGEERLDALKREVLEETGIAELSKIEPLMMVLTNIRYKVNEVDVGLIFSVYLCQVEEFAIVLSDEHKCYEWVMPSMAAEMLAPNHPAELIDCLLAREAVKA